MASSIFIGARGLAPGYLSLWLCVFFIGVCYGFIIPNLTKGVAMWFDSKELGRANGLLLIGANVGAGLGLALGAPLAEKLGGWRNVMFITGALSFVFSILWAVTAKERQYTGIMAELMKQRPGPLQGLKQVLAVKDIWLICITELFFIGNVLALGGIIPTYLVSNKGMTENQAGVCVALSALTTMAGMVVGPHLSDRVGLRKIFIWPFLLISAGNIALLPILCGWPLYVLVMFNGFVGGCILPQLRSIVMELKEIGPALSGSAFGAIFTINRIGGFTIPWLMGVIMTAFTAAFGFYFISLSAVIASILVLFIRETGHRKNSANRIT